MNPRYPAALYLVFLLASCSAPRMEVWALPYGGRTSWEKLKASRSSAGEPFVVVPHVEPTGVCGFSNNGVICLVRPVVIGVPFVRENPNAADLVNGVLVARLDSSMNLHWVKALWGSKGEVGLYGADVTVAPDSSVYVRGISNLVAKLDKQGDLVWAWCYRPRLTQHMRLRMCEIRSFAAETNTLYLAFLAEQAVILAFIDASNGEVKKALMLRLGFQPEHIEMAVCEKCVFIVGITGVGEGRSKVFVVTVDKRTYAAVGRLFSFGFRLQSVAICADRQHAFLTVSACFEKKGFSVIMCVSPNGQAVFCKKIVAGTNHLWFRPIDVAHCKGRLFVVGTLYHNGEVSLLLTLKKEGAIEVAYRFGIVEAVKPFDCAMPVCVIAPEPSTVVVFFEPIGSLVSKKILPPQKMENLSLVSITPSVADFKVATESLQFARKKVSIMCETASLTSDGLAVNMKRTKSSHIPSGIVDRREPLPASIVRILLE